MPAFPASQTCPADDGVSYTSTLSGTNVGATPQVPSPELNCADGTITGPAASVFYSFRASGAINEITVNTSGMNGVQVIGYVGTDCDNLNVRNCATGSGSVTLRIIAQSGETIFFSVSGEAGDPDDQGTFNISVTSSSDCDACAREDNGEVVFNPRNASGTYACGSTVEICFTLFEYAGNDAGSVEWLHSVVPTFGSGWDVSSISPSFTPPSCNGNGNWNWYPAGWTSCETGLSFPFGFAFESNAGVNASCPGFNDPGNNWGDGGNGCTTIPAPITWCFNINVLPCPPGSGTFTGDDLGVSVQVFSDGFSGSWTQQVCAAPVFSSIGSVIVCDDLEPLAVANNQSCPGVNDGSIDIEGNGGLDPGTLYNFVVRNSSSTAVFVCNSCPSPVNTGTLPPGNYVIEATGVISGCPQSTMATIDLGVAPDAFADHTIECPGTGPIQLLGSTTSSGTTITYAWTGPNGFTATGDSPFTNDPADEGTYTLIVTVDGCPSDPVDVEVEYIDFDPMGTATPAAVCFGDDVMLEVTNVGAGAIFIWYDPDGNQLPGNGSTITATTTASGMQNYQVEVLEGSCTVLLPIEVEVADEILAEIVMDPNGQVCAENDITFTVQMVGGGAFPAGWTFDWDNGQGSGATYVRNELIGGQYQVDLIITNPGNCSQPYAEVFQVNPTPEVEISPVAAIICGNGSVELIPNITVGDAPFTYLWGPNEVDMITTPTLVVDANSPELEAIYVIVTDNNGCVGFSNFADVEIIAPLPAVSIDCEVTGIDSLTFSWNDVNQEEFEVYVTIGGNAEVLVDDQYTDLIYGLGNLPENTTVTIRVIPIGGTGNQTCPGPESTRTCTTDPCPNVVAPTVTCGDTGLDFVEINWTDVGADSYTVDVVAAPPGAMTSVTGTTLTATGLTAGESITITVTAVTIAGCPDPVSEEITCVAQFCPPVTPMITTPVDTFCVDGSAGLIDLTVDVPGMGTVTWNGSGVSGSQFDPVAAGPGFHDITVTYSEGTCMYSSSFELGVQEALTGVTLTGSATEFCQVDEGTFSLNGTIPAGFSVEWIVPASSTIVSGNDNTGPLVLTMGGTGAQEVAAVITSAHCDPDTLRAAFTVFAPASPAVVDCENISFDQVGFFWTQAENLPTSYVITNMPAGAMVTENGNSIIVAGLAEGESVTIEVSVTGGTVCADPMPTEWTCTSAACPIVTVALDPVGPFCLNEDATVALNTVINSINADGVLSYLARPGVVGTDFVSTGLAAGDYEVIASYTEAGCTFNDTITVTVNALPVAAFALDNGPACINELVGANAGAVQVGWSYEWIVPAAGATVVNNSTTDISVSWPNSGTQSVGLIVTDDNGCVSDTLFLQIEIEDSLGTPVIGCGASSFTSVEFGWDPIPGATGYEVSVDGGTPFTQDSTNLLIDGLNQGDLVSITVAALGNGACGNGSTSLPRECEVGSCPTIIITAMEDQSFCTGAADNVVVLTAGQSGGAGSGTFVFTGPGVTENNGVYSFDADAAGAGAHQIDVVYTEAICTGIDSITMTVTQTPDSPFTLNGLGDPLTVCEGEDFTIAYSGPLTAPDGAIFNWNFDAADASATAVFENYTASFATAGSYMISLTVSLNECSGSTTLLPVTVEGPLEPLIISCAGSDLNSVTFTWNDLAGATGYQLADGTVLPAGTTEFTVNGLLPGQDTTITLVALSDASCGNGASTTSQPCTTDECPTLSLDASSLMAQTCLENGDETIDLSTVIVTGGTGNGSYTFSGPGVTGSTFDAAIAGGSEAGTVHTIMLDYEEEGPCSFSGTFEVTVFNRPSVFITTVEPTCTDVAVQLIVGSTNFVANQDITIDFDGGTIIDDGDPDDSVYLVSWSTPGTKTVTASVFSNISGCESLPVMREVIVEAPLETPVVSCPDPAELESITFSWGAVAGATGYEVTVNPGGVMTVDAATTTFLIDGLSPETIVSISVIALNNGPCGNSNPGLGACETAPCPGGSVEAITPNTELCLDGEEEAFLLEAELNQGTPSGPFVWSGTGVVDNGDGTFSFDPVGLAAGEYPLTVNYLGEANCTSVDNITVTLFDQPSSNFTVSNNVICADTETTVGLIGAVTPDATYVWDFAGAAQAAGGNPESYLLSWPTAGTYTVSLTATANGCQTVSSLQVTVDAPSFPGEVILTDEAFCAGSANDVNLNDFLDNETEGGVWSVAPASPNNVGGLNIGSGIFNTAQLSAGNYLFLYSVQQGSCPSVSSEVELRLLAPPVADAGEARRLTCTMGMATLDGTGSETGNGYTYRWFSNDPNVVITSIDQTTLDVSQPGTYFLEVTNAIGCSSIDEVVVSAETEAPVMEVEVSNITCFSADDGAILVTGVSGGRAPYTFTLNGEERGASTLFSGLMAQEYNLQITDANGCFTNLILDLTEPDELTISLQFSGDSTTVSAGEEITIVASVNGGNPVDTLIWMPDSLNSGESRNGITFIATETQMISVTVVDELGCSATDREMLLVRKDRRVYFPNAFSPNGDNINDIWFIGGDLDEIEFIDNFFVFDRWGEAVHTGSQNTDGATIDGGDGSQFLPNDPSFGWDGTLNGKTMNPQVLVYTATVHFRDGEVIVYKGDFVLMR